MLKKVAVAVFVMSFIAVSSYAASLKPYIGVKVGGANETAKIDCSSDYGSDVVQKNNGWAAFGAIDLGVKYGPLRAEAEYGYRDYTEYERGSDNESYRGRMQTYFLNFYLDFPTKFFLKPYFNAGAGWAGIDAEAGGDTSNMFAYNVGLGLTYRLSKSFNIDCGYRYVKVNRLYDLDLGSHDLYAGLRYKI
ncbi:MAG: porin family protein [Endomicrobia bacterium]|nr:porin family protein [Endomicrobiia bacterium]